MGNIKDGLDSMTANLRYELQVAWQQSVQQGNIYPLIIFYNKYEQTLRYEYNLSLNELIGIDPNDLVSSNNKTSREGNIKNQKEEQGNPLTEIVFKQTNRSKGTFSIVSILALSVGAILIIKSFKK